MKMIFLLSVFLSLSVGPILSRSITSHAHPLVPSHAHPFNRVAVNYDGSNIESQIDYVLKVTLSLLKDLIEIKQLNIHQRPVEFPSIGDGPLDLGITPQIPINHMILITPETSNGQNTADGPIELDGIAPEPSFQVVVQTVDDTDQGPLPFPTLPTLPVALSPDAESVQAAAVAVLEIDGIAPAPEPNQSVIE